MKIPKGVDHQDFYNQVKKNYPNVKIKSNYKGVSLLSANNGNSNIVYWRAQYNGKLIDTFPFTEEGELQASKAYENHLLTIKEKKCQKQSKA